MGQICPTSRFLSPQFYWNTATPISLCVCLWLLLSYSGRGDCLGQKLCSLQSLKYLIWSFVENALWFPDLETKCCLRLKILRSFFPKFSFVDVSSHWWSDTCSIVQQGILFFLILTYCLCMYFNSRSVSFTWIYYPYKISQFLKPCLQDWGKLEIWWHLHFNLLTG